MGGRQGSGARAGGCGEEGAGSAQSLRHIGETGEERGTGRITRAPEIRAQIRAHVVSGGIRSGADALSGTDSGHELPSSKETLLRSSCDVRPRNRWSRLRRVARGPSNPRCGTCRTQWAMCPAGFPRQCRVHSTALAEGPVSSDEAPERVMQGAASRNGRVHCDHFLTRANVHTVSLRQEEIPAANESHGARPWQLAVPPRTLHREKTN